MKYDFTSIIDRHGRDSIAVDGLKGDGFSPAPPKEGFDAIPMWVADMNFPTVPTIQQAIIERASHPAFGYFEAPPEYYKAIIRWQETRHGVTGLKPRHIGYENGVLGGVISALNCICSRGDNVLVHSPTYIGFTSSLKNNGYEAVHSPLVRDENGIWRMDYADMEKQLREKKIHAAILCNPHNPCGRVWERRELEKAMELYRKYDVYVISGPAAVYMIVFTGKAERIVGPVSAYRNDIQMTGDADDLIALTHFGITAVVIQVYGFKAKFFGNLQSLFQGFCRTLTKWFSLGRGTELGVNGNQSAKICEHFF